jgi:hypothetical protein
MHHVVTISPSSGAGRAGPFDASTGNVLLATASRAPFFDATRALLLRGFAKPTDTAVLVSTQDPTVEIARGAVATAALLTGY